MVRQASAESPADAKAEVSAQERAFFETKIRPVLVKHCYECHAQGAKKLGGKLRLDTAAGLRQGGESGIVFVAGEPDKSLIIQSLRYEHLEMPPKAPLSGAVVKDFETWVRMGAPDPRDSDKKIAAKSPDSARSKDPALWSFQPIADPAVPEVAKSDWPRDPLDRFVLARLAARKLSPARDASATVLIRRLYFDLIGLPPSLEEVRAFESDFHQRGQAAVETLVDRLLASPQFGERWGRHWLDVARYGESNGNDGLGRNPTFPHAWRYRDYVIAAFNDDVPYDRFITEQVAGDLLEASSPAERDRLLIATGFLALGAKPAKAMNSDFDMDVVADQIDVVSTGVMGLSVACARCHDHKHDPIPTRDYYSLAGIFKSTETLWGNAANEKLTAPPTPLHELATMSPPSPKRDDAKPYDVGAPRFPKSYAAQIAQLKPLQYLPLDAASEELKLESGAALSKTDYGVFTGGRMQGKLDKATDAFTVSFWFRNDHPIATRPVTAYLFSIGPDGKGPQPGDHLGIAGNYDSKQIGKLVIFNGNKRNQLLFGTTIIPPRTWNHVVYVRDGKRVAAYLNGQIEPEFEGEIDRTAPEATTWFLGARNDRFAPLEGNAAQLAFFAHALSVDEIQLLHKASGQPRGIGKQLPARPKGVESVPSKALAMGVRDRAKPGDCKININGVSNRLGAEVPRGFLSACITSSSPEPIDPARSGRIELARWLTRGDHPQTARVMVNRIWLHLFGRGLVDTPDDFGVYGSRPTHPLLLDHLATRFMSNGWSIKRMIRAIVLSRTYQLDSYANAAAIDADPDCRWLSHHARRRLDAESLRDSMLKVSGQLDLSPGQGSDVQNLDVLVNTSDNLHRPSNHRSVYQCMLRNSPPPELAAFNLPTFESVKSQRDVTTLPAHALYLLNNPFVVEQSEHFARAALESVANDERTRVIWMYRRALNREPSTAELAGALKLIQAVEADLASQQTDADNRRWKAWAGLGQALLATNEFRYVD